MIRAFQGEDGYPDTLWAFYESNSLASAQVTLLEGGVLENVVVRFGPKSAWLIGTVVDNETEKPIEQLSVTMMRDDSPKLSMGVSYNTHRTGGKFVVWIPRRPVRIAISAKNYTGLSAARGRLRSILSRSVRTGKRYRFG